MVINLLEGAKTDPPSAAKNDSQIRDDEDVDIDEEALAANASLEGNMNTEDGKRGLNSDLSTRAVSSQGCSRVFILKGNCVNLFSL